MKQWEIWSYDFPDAGMHPAVVISHPDRVVNKPYVNLLCCSTHRASRLPGPGEIILNGADGLDWETLCQCDLIYIAPKTELSQRRGLVSPQRRIQIARRILESCGWAIY
jgi:hypothetical protein